MESSKTFFCHTCKKQFSTVVSGDDDVACPTCQEPFVEEIENPSHQEQLNDLYTSPHQEEEQKASQQQPQVSSQTFQMPNGTVHVQQINFAPLNFSSIVQNLNQQLNQINQQLQSQQQNAAQQNPGQHNAAQPHAAASQNQVQANVNAPGNNGAGQPAGEGQPDQDAQEDDGDDDWEDEEEENEGAEGEAVINGQNIDIQLNFNQILGSNNPIQALMGQLNQPLSQAFSSININGNVFSNMNQMNQVFHIDNMNQNMLNQALQQSLELALNQTQGVATSKQFIDQMKFVKGSELTEKQDCKVCFDQFGDDDLVGKLPCKHTYHKDCILPWLVKHNTCPVCRYELPTDNVAYENQRRQDPSSAQGSGNQPSFLNYMS